MFDNKQDNKIELIRNLFIAGSSAIPVVGGTLSVLLDKYLPSAIEKRRTDFLKQLEIDFNKLPYEIINSLESNECFYSIFLKVLSQVTYEHKTEKINAFRNILINSTLITDIEFNEVEYFIKLINSLSIDQIKILHLFYLDLADIFADHFPYTFSSFEKEIEFTDINKFIDKHWKVDPSYRWSLVTELIRDGLISSSIERQHKKGKGIQLSKMGEDFINYIFNPVSI